MFASNDNRACLLVFRTICIDTARAGCHVTVMTGAGLAGERACSAVAFSKRVRGMPPGCHCKGDNREPRVSPSMQDRSMACFWSVIRVLVEPLDYAYEPWHACMLSLFYGSIETCKHEI